MSSNLLKSSSFVFLIRCQLVFAVLSNFCCSVLDAGRYEVFVNDQDGNPVENVDVTVGFDELPFGLYKNRKGTTGEDGQFQFSGWLYNVGFLAASKAGYYDTGVRFEATYSDPKTGKTKTFRRKTIEVELKVIKDPVPMFYSVVVDKDIPVLGRFFGFDLQKGDWVKPHGKGVEANCYLKLEKKPTIPEVFLGIMSIRFPNKGDGLIPFEIIPFEGQFSGSEMKSDYFAPKSGYEQEWEWVWHWDETRESGNSVRFDYSRTRSYYFRTNTVLNEKDEVVSANYGKIFGDLKFRLREEGPSRFTWGGIYYNPVVNDRRVEFDRTRPLPDSLLDEQRKDREYLIRSGIEVEGPLMLRGVNP